MELKTITLISVTMIIVSACRSTTNPTDPLSVSPPDIGVPIQSDKYLDITAPNGWNSFKAGERVSLMIINVSDKQIIAKQDFGARIFVFAENKWIEIENRVVYYNDEITLNPNKNFDPAEIVSLFVLPELPNHSTSSYIRIFIIGAGIENAQVTNEFASYIDLQLHP